jgi:predicted metallo-beta-lactamase superfamily hydrolase
MGGNYFLKRRKEKFAKNPNMRGIDVVLERVVERRVQDYKLLRDPNYKLLRELKKEGKSVESGMIELDEGNSRG